MKGLSDTDQRLMLSELTVDTANAATRMIARHAVDRADLLDLLDKIRPTPHTPEPGPATRRALPLRGVSAR